MPVRGVDSSFDELLLDGGGQALYGRAGCAFLRREKLVQVWVHIDRRAVPAGFADSAWRRRGPMVSSEWGAERGGWKGQGRKEDSHSTMAYNATEAPTGSAAAWCVRGAWRTYIAAVFCLVRVHDRRGDDPRAFGSGADLVGVLLGPFSVLEGGPRCAILDLDDARLGVGGALGKYGDGLAAGERLEGSTEELAPVLGLAVDGDIAGRGEDIAGGRVGEEGCFVKRG